MTEPSTAARKLASDILMRHPPCLRDDVPMNYLIDDIAASIEQLRAEVERLRAAIQESYEEQLYAALGDGVTGNGGNWWPGGMSTAEWFCRCAGISYVPKFKRTELATRVPEIARTLVHQQLPETKEG